MFKRLSLRYALPLWIIFLTLCFTIGEIAYTLKSRETSIYNNFQLLLRSDGNRLSAQIEQILREKNSLPIQQQEIRRLFSLYLTGSMTDLLLLDRHNETIASGSVYHRSDPLFKGDEEAVGKVAKSGTNIIVHDRHHRTLQGFFSVRMPPKRGELHHDGYGTLVISVSYSRALDDEYLNAYESLFLRLSAIMIVIIAIIIFLRQRVISPIASMSDTIAKIANGDAGARMDLAARDELGEIADSFNQMVETLNRQKEELERYKNDLEAQVATEISKRREQEAIMMQQSRMAGMGEMIGNIAHQWRQPLNALSLICINVKDAYDYEELTSEFLQKSTAKAEVLIRKMSTTIDDFRNFFKPDKEIGAFNLKDTVDEAYGLVDVAFTQQGIGVDIRIDPSLEVRGYKNEFSQVILNLLNNARDVLEERAVKEKKIHIRLLRKGSHIVLTLQDNGGGIPQAVLPRIFDPYFSTKEEGKGTGIGLYMSKTIIEEHHKGVLHASNEGEGACFTIILPAL
ncbi:MAG: ATP-binding protein [Sulfuricurvum sp.]|jgi:signal transduction histidine kinase|uniref:sensor histidine kinase n=1 Tax=Sulfuricurvum sp. TaxID=2025608 RepID=UPI0025D798B4|nr:ATP-binding protein [Sulfuricurvum sp.]MCK9373282.1 ATP-binding protein [Sulfuricurvum sp.]